MDLFLEKLFSFTRFTTNKVSKNFLPRRMGLGYKMKHQKLDREVIKPCLKSKVDGKGRADSIGSKPVIEDLHEELGKSKFVKRHRKFLTK